MNQRLARIKRILIASFVAAGVLMSSCSATSPLAPAPTNVVQSDVNADEQLLAKVDFNVTLPVPIPDDQKLSIEIMDEVTGLALNSSRYPMSRKDELHYSLQLPQQARSVVKYRYVREGGLGAIEYTSQNRQVRYRLFQVVAPAEIDDIVSGWNDTPYKGPYGRIQGMVLEAASNSPLPGMLVAAGGQQTITASDGSFILDGLPPGKHNLVVYSLDGAFPPFQQEAIVATESSTPAEIRIDSAQMVKITFNVQSSVDVPEGIPIRIIGNTYPLGNTFADLRGGVSTLSSRAPLINYQNGRNYQFVMQLPAGMDLRYKYTLGDGFWNSERNSKGKFMTRQLIVPDKDATVTDVINSFTTPGVGPITFNLEAVAGTSQNEVVSIQFNPYGWTEPIPMWHLGDNRWIYILYTPLDADIIGNASYRYCKNDQCGILDDGTTSGQDAVGKVFKTSPQPQVIQDVIRQWSWVDEEQTTITVPSDPIKPKPSGFVTGVELLPGYHPSWQAYLNGTFATIHDMRANWVILSPTWHFTSVNPPVLAQVQGVDASWYDLSQMAILAKDHGLKFAVSPTTMFYQPAEIWWHEGARDANWWQSWYDRYETFILNHADFANQSGADALILGDEMVSSALPGGKLTDGSDAGVPQDVEERWSSLLTKVRAHYSGKIIWRIHFPVSAQGIPSFVKGVDELYILIDGKITDQENPDAVTIQNSVNNLMEHDIRALRDTYTKPVLIGVAYPSASGAAAGCINNGGACLPVSLFNQAGLDIQAVSRNLTEQAIIYNGVLSALNQSDWVDGVVAGGYFPVVAVQDKSRSVRGKPAGDVLWFWYDHLNPDQNK